MPRAQGVVAFIALALHAGDERASLVGVHAATGAKPVAAGRVAANASVNGGVALSPWGGPVDGITFAGDPAKLASLVRIARTRGVRAYAIGGSICAAYGGCYGAGCAGRGRAPPARRRPPPNFFGRAQRRRKLPPAPGYLAQLYHLNNNIICN